MASRLTNIHNLPESIVKAVELDTHRLAGDISVTTLIDAPQIRQLKKGHIVTEDVMDRVFALYGTMAHGIFDRAEVASADARKLVAASGVLTEIAVKNSDEQMKKAASYVESVATKTFPDAFNNNVLTEKTLVIEVDGMTISGTFDRFIIDKKKLQDYKMTSVYEYIFPESRKKRWAQFNIYAGMLREHGYEVEQSEVVYLFRDWSRGEVKKGNRDYPQHPIFLDDKVPMLSQKEVMDFIKKRVALHKAADAGETVPCTGKDRWSNADSYAVMVKGGKRAKKLVPTRELAEAYIKSEGGKFLGPYIEVRPGEDRRCAEFCPVRDICPQRKERLEIIQKQGL